MKKNISILKKIFYFSIINLPLFSSISCNSNINQEIEDYEINNNKNNDIELQNKKELRKKSNNFIDLNQKINYISLGDSISAGFDGTLDKDYPGEKNGNTITGLSFSSFLARILNKDNNRIENFKNYAVSGATILDFNLLLGFLNEEEVRKEDKHLKTFFGENYLELGKEIKNQLKNSNFVTITLGANDFFHTFFESLKELNIKEIISNLENKNSNILNYFSNNLEKILKLSQEKITERLNLFLSNLKVIAPKTNINLISYPMPLLKLKKLIDDMALKFINSETLKNQKISDFILSSINNTIENIARKNNINYINSYNQEYWELNKNELISLFLDIHPNTKAYKKMAMDIYLKITNKYKDFKEPYYKYDFNDKFVSSDNLDFEYQIETSDKLEDIFGNSSKEYLNTLYSFEQEKESIRSKDNYGKRIIGLTNMNEGIVDNVINAIFSSEFITFLDPSEKLLNFLKYNDSFFIKKLQVNLVKSELIYKTYSKLENILSDLEKNNNLSFDNIYKKIKEELFTTENLTSIFGIFSKTLNDLINSEKNLETKNELISNFKILAVSLIKKMLLSQRKNLENFINEKVNNLNNNSLLKFNINSSINTLLEEENLDPFINLFLKSYTENIEQFQNLVSFKELIIKFTKYSVNELNKSENTNIKLKIKDFILTLYKDNNDKIIDFLLFALKSKKINFDEQQDKEILKKIIDPLFKTVLNSEEFLNAVNQIFVELKKEENNYSNFVELINILTKSLIKSALFELLNQTPDVENKLEILFSKAFTKLPFLKSLINSIESNVFVKFVNRIFEASDINNKTGIYSLLENADQESGILFGNIYYSKDIGTIELANKLGEIVSYIFTPIYKDFVNKVKNNEITESTLYKDTETYKAGYRLFTLLHWKIRHQKEINTTVYWSSFTGFAGYDVVALINWGINKAIQDGAISEEDKQNPIFSSIIKGKLGIKEDTNKNLKFNDWYFGGEDTRGFFGVSEYNFKNDNIIFYLYDLNKLSSKDKFQKDKTRLQVVLESFVNGYIGDKK
ncbi:SGNH/GDSL hydrolase family protein [Mesomycoplasma molare]|uniref:SGNH/GDSL hydrolase family protein n=1 Tax=Mesomycoplasma molare TaxID=171288 RepID=A0ABY5TY05_9BACT|nr:SGNH/GDSL hydrolase family protein [Mesomycoplasma molare]UWD34451.1 SGNH/GDSL hydrolase family protein [Mesomycoplasma molare]